MDYKAMYEKILAEHQQVFEQMDVNGMREFIETIKKYQRIFLIGVGR